MENVNNVAAEAVTNDTSAVASPSAKSHIKVLVTGANGYVASWVVHELLQHGYSVRGTVRNIKDEKKWKHLTKIAGADSRLEVVESELLTPDSFDAAVVGCEIVIHTASPYSFNVKNAQKDLVDPAIQGTLNVLRSCRKIGGVKKVVLTSSTCAVVGNCSAGKVFTEENWNNVASLTYKPYYFSKRCAEEAAWNFVKELPPAEAFKLVVINPSGVIGPDLAGLSVNQTVVLIQRLCLGDFPALPDISAPYVDVRDVAISHRLAFELEGANGRYICCNETNHVREMVEIIERHFTHFKLPFKVKLPNLLVNIYSAFEPGQQGQWLRSAIGFPELFSNAKIKKDLGLKFRTTEQSVVDTVTDLRKWNILPTSSESELQWKKKKVFLEFFAFALFCAIFLCIAIYINFVQ